MASHWNFDISIDLPKPVSRTEAAWADLVEGMSKSWVWSAMAMEDIKMRYRGSLLGPFWLTISMAIMIAAMGLIYARLFNMEVTHYLPFLTVGLVSGISCRRSSSRAARPSSPPITSSPKCACRSPWCLAFGLPQSYRLGP
jgi:hypothetical protein